MDNKAIATILSQTADLMEIAGEDGFRIRSYQNAAEAIESLSQPVAEIAGDVKALLAIPGIGKSMAAHLQEIVRKGKLKHHQELLKKYKPTVLDLLKVQGLGPKTIALIWDSFHVSDLASVEKLARAGKLRELPRMGEKQEQKILKSIETFRQISGRFRLDQADTAAKEITAFLEKVPGVASITPAGSLRRGRESIGDLDLLVTEKPKLGKSQRSAILKKTAQFPGVTDVIALGENKVSFRLHTGMQVDVRLLPPESFGAALLYFTGSKSHNVSLRQRALKMGYTLNEYELAKLEGERRVAGKSEEEIYGKLGLDYIEPELRENTGEIAAAEAHSLPELITREDIRGDVHMHTVATDGRCTIEEMAGAAHDRGYEYMAITDHSKNLAYANGLDDTRAAEHTAKIRAVAKEMEGIRVLAGIEVDILSDGALDLSDSVLEEMDVVIASVHSNFQQEPAEMTERLVRAVSNKSVSVLGHPTGRMLGKRDAYKFDVEAVFAEAAKHKVAMELNASPQRLDLSDLHVRMAREKGLPIVINTDAHHTSHLGFISYGLLQARRAWLTKSDVLNTLPAKEFIAAMKKKWPRG